HVLAVVFPAIRRAAAAVEAEVDGTSLHRVPVDLQRVARLEQRVADGVISPAEEHRADHADALVGEDAELDLGRGAGLLRAVDRAIGADAAQHRVREPDAIERRALEVIEWTFRR